MFHSGSNGTSNAPLSEAWYLVKEVLCSSHVVFVCVNGLLAAVLLNSEKGLVHNDGGHSCVPLPM